MGCFRVAQGQMVGKMLPASQGKNVPTHSPEECSHPDQQMIPRANKTSKWWTCKACNSRWEREDLPVAKEGPPQGDERMLLGKHAGRTFCWIYDQEKTYAQWALQTVESGDMIDKQLARLARYVASREMTEVWHMDDQEEKDL